MDHDAPTLLLIHGFPTSSWDFSPIWQALTTHFNVIAPDLLGFGFSAKPVAYDYSILDQADLCEALLTRLGVNRFHILAHNYGDSVAQELLARAHDGSALAALHGRKLRSWSQQIARCSFAGRPNHPAATAADAARFWRGAFPEITRR